MDDDTRILRLSAAICLAPMLAAAVCAAGIGILLAASGDFHDALGLVGLAAMFGVSLGLGLGLPAMLLIGLPTHAWLRWTGRASIYAYATTGIAPGVLAALVLLFNLPPPPGSWEGPAFVAFIGAITGAVSGGLFWWIRRPDLDRPNLATPQA